MGVRVDVANLSKSFLLPTGRRLRALEDISFTIEPGQTLGVVGESGSGKSTLARCILHLLPATSGRVVIDDIDMAGLSGSKLRRARGRFQMVFQDPYAAVDPRQTIGGILEEPLILHSSLSRVRRRQRVTELLGLVRLTAAHIDRYPHQLSGGQLQRIGIARAIATDPAFLILDEPTSSLDVSVRSGILTLLKGLQKRLGITVMVISHDLETIAEFSDRVAVMYLGTIVESGPAAEVLGAPEHPYTQALISAVLSTDPRDRGSRIHVAGEIPSPVDVPTGCVFASRCPISKAECMSGRPAYRVVGARVASCIRIDDQSNQIAGHPSASPEL
jgi:oligopeptide/dipeptide ABC transporter ATP-binding protein